MSRHKRIIVGALTLCIALLTGGCSSSVPGDREGGITEITPELAHRYVFTLAADSMLGRDTPSHELDVAATFIADEFRAAGLQPVKGSYLHDVGLGVVSLGDDNRLGITRDGSTQEYTIKSQFTPFDMTGNSEATGEIVFAGYGITAPEYEYDDYADIDVRGKIVFVLRHEPGEQDANSTFKGTEATEYSNVPEKVQIAIDHGAIAVLVATDPLNHGLLTPRGFPWPSLSKIIPNDALPVTILGDESSKIPVVHVGEEAITQLFGSVDELRSIQRSIDESLQPRSAVIRGATARVKTSTSIRHIPANNVLGFLEGSDPILKDQIIVVGAHYDHVGYRRSQPAGQDSVYNGADDNASGTSAMMQVARAFGTSAERPRRSVLLMAFAGEEKGLLGSRAYALNPALPLEKTVAMINLDMIGRNSVDSLFIVGAPEAPELAEFTRQENAAVGFTFSYDNSVSGRSDHASFVREGVPAIAYFSGFHPDYHKVADNPEFVNIVKVAKVAQLAFRTAWRIANDDQTYTLQKSHNP